MTAEEAGQAIAEGLAQGVWQFNEMKRPPEEKKPVLERVDVLAPSETEAVARGHLTGAAIGAGQTLARGIQVLPGNVCTPTYVAQTATEIASRHGFAITVLDKAAIVKEKMGALLAVAQGSSEEPRFIALEYKGADRPPVVLVGKGVTFDTGRHFHQARAEHGRDEVRHVGGRRGAGHLRDPGSAATAGACRRPDPQHGEHALRHRGQAGRRDHLALGQDNRSHQYRRRRSTHSL